MSARNFDGARGGTFEKINKKLFKFYVEKFLNFENTKTSKSVK
jgi:vacuolar-type H+-ATPase subunit C/Vma6